MAKALKSSKNPQYQCRECGEFHLKWNGRCDKCGAWNSLEEQKAPTATILPNVSRGTAPKLEICRLDGETHPPPRINSGMNEFNRVLGGGFVSGSALLIGGDPGIGKSTLMLQAAHALAFAGTKVLYVSGEEAPDQIRLRARRLGLDKQKKALDLLDLASSIQVASVVQAIESASEKEAPQAVIIDSIQTMWSENASGVPGSVSQVRECAFELIRLAKERGFALILIGHVTKEGALAGPRVLEHMVDAVLYFEGERGHQFRILRAAKNRFGATDEIGVFSMEEKGLMEVPNPSALFLAERRGNIAGSAVFAGLEGTRPVLLEIQALLAPKAGDGSARRSVLGWENGRLNMLLAVLEARCGVSFAGKDIFLNVAGGLNVKEAGADLAVAAALLSASTSVPAPPDAVFFGEVGLSGELRQAPQTSLRLKESAKMGFHKAFMPRQHGKGKKDKVDETMTLYPIGHLSDLVKEFQQNEKN
ncbi:DNA repair protein RadA [Acetobacteraceae bacterium]|nr:DNA repair protein RadA [Acetobacteraceae bacterium]